MYKEDPDLESPIEELVTKTEDFYETMVSSMPKEVFLKLAKTDKKNEDRKKRSFEEGKIKALLLIFITGKQSIKRIWCILKRKNCIQA